MYINDLKRRTFLALVGSYKSGTHICPKNASIISNGKAEVIEIEFDAPTNVCIDGEIKIFDKITLSARKKMLKLLVPAACENLGEENEAARAL